MIRFGNTCFRVAFYRLEIVRRPVYCGLVPKRAVDSRAHGVMFSDTVLLDIVDITKKRRKQLCDVAESNTPTQGK